jgi:hypothetical protein
VGSAHCGRGTSYVACFAVAVGAVGAELVPRGAGCGRRRPGSRWSADNLDWTGLDWTGLWTGLDWTLDNCWHGRWARGVSSCGTPAESGARTRLRESEPIDRRSWPAWVRIEWCGVNSVPRWYDGGAYSLDDNSGWNGGPEGASATRECGGWPTGRSSLTAPSRAGEGSGWEQNHLRRPHPKPSNSRRHLDHLTMRGGGRVRRAGARLPGSAQSARGGSGRGQAWNDPDLTCGVDPTELGDWPTRGLPEAWQRGPTTRCALLRSGDWRTWVGSASPTVCGPTMAAAVQWGPGGDQCLRHPSIVDSDPVCKIPGDPPGQAPHWSRGLGQAGVNWVRHAHPPRGPGPGSRAGRAIRSRRG